MLYLLTFLMTIQVDGCDHGLFGVSDPFLHGPVCHPTQRECGCWARWHGCHICLAGGKPKIHYY